MSVRKSESRLPAGTAPADLGQPVVVAKRQSAVPSVTSPLVIRPPTSLPRTGLNQATPTPCFLHEEAVSRAAVRITEDFQRIRWRDGRARGCLGGRKQTARGEGSIGIAFDRIEDVKT